MSTQPPCASLVPTEQMNPDTVGIDQMSTGEILTAINQADQTVPLAVAGAIPKIAQVVEACVKALSGGGKLVYFGAGTSGRLGILDAAECPPTYSTLPQQVQAFIAGGQAAVTQAVEGAEDSPELGMADATAANLGPNDIAIGISASGNAPYVVSALEAATSAGAYTACITSNPKAAIAQIAQVAVVAETGPEVIAGSTRMKAGTAQKLILNMITTATMVQLGKTYQNLMVDVRPTNAKLVARAKGIVATLGQVSEAEAEALLAKSQQQVKPAVVMARLGLDYRTACARLANAGGKLRVALGE